MDSVKTLHILNKSPDHSRARLCQGAITPGDALLLTENGVLGATQPNPTAQLYALVPDLEARGISAPPHVQQISYQDMVKLTASAENVISW